jgi:hypothetical protein
MSDIPFGTIVLTDFPFTDLTIDKSIIAGRLGAAETAWLIEHRKTFFGVFGFDYSTA